MGGAAVSLVRTTLEYHFPGHAAPVDYSQQLDTDAIGAVLLVMDALAGEDDPERIRILSAAVQRALAEA